MLIEEMKNRKLTVEVSWHNANTLGRGPVGGSGVGGAGGGGWGIFASKITDGGRRAVGQQMSGEIKGGGQSAGWAAILTDKNSRKKQQKRRSKGERGGVSSQRKT